MKTWCPVVVVVLLSVLGAESQPEIPFFRTRCQLLDSPRVVYREGERYYTSRVSNGPRHLQWVVSKGGRRRPPHAGRVYPVSSNATLTVMRNNDDEFLYHMYCDRRGFDGTAFDPDTDCLVRGLFWTVVMFVTGITIGTWMWTYYYLWSYAEVRAVHRACLDVLLCKCLRRSRTADAVPLMPVCEKKEKE